MIEILSLELPSLKSEELSDSMFLHVLGDLIGLGLVLLVDAKMLHQSLCVHILFIP